MDADKVAGTVQDLTERNRSEAEVRFSERQLRSYIEHAGDAIYVVAQDSGRIIYCNQQACRALGYSRDELLQMSARDIETELKAEDIERVHRSLDENSKLQLEGVHRRKDGTTFPVEINLSRLDGAEPPSLLSLVRDITERKRMAEALRASETQYRSYVESSPIGVFVCDERGRYLQVNPAAAAITGYRVEELIQMSIADITPMECQERALRHFQSVLQTGRASGELAFRHKDGHMGYWLVEAVRLTALAGAVTFVCCSVSLELTANVSAIAAVALTFVFRLLTIIFNWRTAPVSSGTIFAGDDEERPPPAPPAG